MNKVKIQAMSEVQKAVAEAEQKAFEVIATERARMEQTIADVKRQAAEDAFLVINEQEESTEVRGSLGYRLGWVAEGAASPLLATEVLGRKAYLTHAGGYLAIYVYSFLVLTVISLVDVGSKFTNLDLPILYPGPRMF